MPSSSRIISAEDLGDVEPFSMNALAGDAESPLMQRAVIRPVKPNDDSALRQSFELGYRKGMSAGRAAAEQQHQQEQRALGATLRQRVEMLALALEAELSEFQNTAAERLMDLAIDIARQTVRSAVHSQRESIVPVIHEALGQLVNDSTAATLRLNPLDVELVRSNLASTLERRHIDIQPDPSISLGGCHLSSASSDVDARVETRWRRTLAAMGRVDPLPDPLGGGLADPQSDPFGDSSSRDAPPAFSGFDAFAKPGDDPALSS